MQMKVRAFRESIQVGNQPLVLEVSGKIEHGVFIFSAYGREHTLPTSLVSEDAHGLFALIEPFESEFKPSWWLRVEPEFDEGDEECGCHISVKYNPDLRRIQLELASRGKNPDDFNLLVPPRAGLSIYFSPGGFIDGKGAGGVVGSFEIPTA